MEMKFLARPEIVCGAGQDGIEAFCPAGSAVEGRAGGE